MPTIQTNEQSEYFPVVIYARYSSLGQREESIEGQLRECRAFAERNGWTVVGEYIDRALSGKTDKRDDFQRMIRDSEKGRFAGVLMYTLDRFARNRFDSATYKARLKKNGVRVFYAKQTIPDGPEGIILESVLEGYAEYYSENLSRNVKRGMKENALQCKTTGSVCLGYRRGNDGKFEIVPAEAKVVQEIFQMYADGVSATQVVLYCNNRGYTTAHGKAFTRNSLRTILRNKKYIGIYEYEDVCIEDGIPAIVSREIFEKVQSMLKHNYSARAKSKAVTDYLLTTKVFCGHCGAPMIGDSGTSRHGNTYRYYKCACRKQNPTACKKKTERKEWLEEFVVRTIVDTALTDENIEDIATKAAALYEAESTDTRLLASCEQTLADVNSRLNNILDLMEQGIATATTKDRLLDLESQKQDLEKRIEHERRKKPTLTKERIAFWLMSFRGGDIKDPEYQRRVIDTLLNSIYVYDTDPNGRKFVFSFNLSKHPTSTLTLSDVSDIVCSGVPNCANPNPVFFMKNCFGFVVEIEDVG